jgi:hypothetical protein
MNNLPASLPLHHCFASIGLPETVISISTVAIACAVPVAIVVATMAYKHRSEKLWNETARLALEKGQPIPERPLSEDEMKIRAPSGMDLAEWERSRRRRRREKDMRGGLITLAIGVALYLAERGAQSSSRAPLGHTLAPILMGIGAALLLSALFGALFFKSNDSVERRPGS